MIKTPFFAKIILINLNGIDQRKQKQQKSETTSNQLSEPVPIFAVCVSTHSIRVCKIII